MMQYSRPKSCCSILDNMFMVLLTGLSESLLFDLAKMRFVLPKSKQIGHVG